VTKVACPMEFLLCGQINIVSRMFSFVLIVRLFSSRQSKARAVCIFPNAFRRPYAFNTALVLAPSGLPYFASFSLSVGRAAKMAEAPPRPCRFFCHRCSEEINPRLPVRRSGFNEPLPAGLTRRGRI